MRATDGDDPPARVAPDTTAAEDRLIQAARGYLPQLMRQFQTTGLNIAVAHHGRVIWEEGFGLADVATERPMTADTVMRSGSMGKVYVATAVMQLVEAGVVDLDRPMAAYLTDVPIRNPYSAREPTVRDFLTHRSGLAENGAHCHFVHPEPLRTHLPRAYAREHVEHYDGSTDPLWNAAAGESFVYSNLGMATLGYLVERTNPEGLSFSSYVQRHVLEPLAMTSSCYPPVGDAPHVPAALLDRVSNGYATLGPVWLPTPAIWFADFPAGGVLTTPGDHTRLLLAYLGGGMLDGRRLLREDTVEEMLRPHVTDLYGRPDNALGITWFLGNAGRADRWFGHGGAHMWGWHNDSRAYPELDLAVTVATNQWNLTGGSPVVWAADFLVQHLANEARLPGRVVPEHSWAWKTSYLIGLMTVDLTVGSLGIPEPLSAAQVDEMVRGAQQRYAGHTGQPLWDPDGFRSGVADLLSVPRTRTAVAEFLASDRLAVAREELDLLWQAIGGSGQIPLSPLGHRVTFPAPAR